MGRPSKYSPEVRERAVRMVFEHTPEHPSQWAAIRSVAEKVGCTAEKRCAAGCARRSATRGQRPGLTTDERERLKAAGARNRRAEARERDSAEGVGVFRPGGARPPTEVMVAFIDEHRETLRGRADLRACCRSPRRRTSGTRRSRRDPTTRSARAQRDDGAARR